MQYLTNSDTISLNQASTITGRFMDKEKVQAPLKKTQTKPLLSYLFLAGNSIRDINTKKFSFIDVFDSITIPKELGFYYSSFYVGGRINNVSTGSVKTIVQIISPDGSTFSTSTLSGDLIKGDLGFSAAFSLMKFEKDGRYYLRVVHNDVTLKDNDQYYFDVKIA